MKPFDIISLSPLFEVGKSEELNIIQWGRNKVLGKVVSDLIADVPESSGVYCFIGRQNKYIYVGEACVGKKDNLRKRLDDHLREVPELFLLHLNKFSVEDYYQKTKEVYPRKVHDYFYRQSFSHIWYIEEWDGVKNLMYYQIDIQKEDLKELEKCLIKELSPSANRKRDLPRKFHPETEKVIEIWENLLKKDRE